MSELTVSEEQVLHNKLSFEINQELIHLMKRIIEIQQENNQLKEKMNETLDRNIKYNVEIVDLQQENQQLEERINKALDFIDSKVISNGEIIDQLRKIEIKELIEILNGKNNE